MKIILSPAKTMIIDTDSLPEQGYPVYLLQAERIKARLQSMSREQLKNLWGCSDKLTDQNMERLRDMDLRRCLTPAILSYEGIAFQYMAPAVFETGQFHYVQEHLRILSAFYGVLKPMDGVTPYRLEMQARLEVDGSKSLYDYWGELLYEQVRDEDGIIINLASKEYSKCIERYLKPADTYITIRFCEESKGRLVTKGTYAKMARGEMVRFVAEKRITSPEGIKQFDRLGYSFREDISSGNEFIFERCKRDKTRIGGNENE